MLCVSVLVDKHPIGIILKSNQLRGIRFSILKEHWKGTSAYARLPDVVLGSFKAWSGRSKNVVSTPARSHVIE